MSDLNYFGPPYADRFKKGVDLDRDHDTSQLKAASLSRTPHKDYLGHCFRWGFVSRFVNRKSRILDAGCGQELPLMHSLGGANPNTVPELYVGVDMNALPEPRRKWAVTHGEMDVAAWSGSLGTMYDDFNLVVSLEVYEHIAPHLALRYLFALRELLSPDGILILSTPVYCHSFKQARNHVNERTKAEIEDDLRRAGFKIRGQYGTFGNYRDLRKMLEPGEAERFELQRQFYGDDVLGCYLAPRFPEASRNITHVCVGDDRDDVEECELKESIVA